MTHLLQSVPTKTFYLWSDSQIVLHWLTTNRKLKTFERNRVTEIQELTESRKWNYCSTDQNPADLLTLGITAHEYLKSKLWKSGPDWLTDERNFPSLQLTTENAILLATTDEQQDEVQTQTEPGIHNVIDIKKFSIYRRQIRVTAYVIRFINLCKAKLRTSRSLSSIKPLTVSELQEAEKLWLLSCQSTSYHAEITSLKSKDKRTTLVKQLQLFLDQEGFIRCGGRIHNAPLPELTRFPYLFPAKHPLTRVIVLDAHANQLHAGTSALVSHIRQRYWIPSIRQYIQGLLKKCVTCRKVMGKLYRAPDPPPLPKIRVQDATPFTVTGVDFTGALHIRGKSGIENAYICLLTCASTRAVHLEVVPDLSTETFIQAFRRFASRKSLPRTMISDNAMTFSAAANTIQSLIRSTTVQDMLNRHGTEWRFIAKRAPWFGGWWERLIGITKSTIKKVLGRALVSYETLHTIVTEIEGVMNDRSLSYVTSDASDQEPLTPAHLLYGRRITSLPHQEDVPVPHVTTQTDVTKRARAQGHLICQFRERWRHEYLTSLRQFHQTSGDNNQTIRVGDVVQIYDESPRTQWKLGTIMELLTGNDSLTQAATLRTSSGLITSRPIVKLYPLEVLLTFSSWPGGC